MLKKKKGKGKLQHTMLTFFKLVIMTPVHDPSVTQIMAGKEERRHWSRKLGCKSEM
jgi:hypothetical protein